MKDALFDGSIPEHYEAGLGPLLFGWSAEELADRVRVPAGSRVLETACGTGISAEALRRALPEDVELVATDLNGPMLEVAGAKRGSLPGLSFQEADAQELPFEDGSFDALACQFGLMFFPERDLALREARRVLRPDGLAVFSTWDSLEANAPAGIAQQSIASFFPDDPPRFLELPFSMTDEEELARLAESAGFERIDVCAVERSVEVPSARGVAEGFVRGNPNINAIRERGDVDPEVVVEGVHAALVAELGDAPMRADLRAARDRPPSPFRPSGLPGPQCPIRTPSVNGGGDWATMLILGGGGQCFLSAERESADPALALLAEGQQELVSPPNPFRPSGLPGSQSPMRTPSVNGEGDRGRILGRREALNASHTQVTLGEAGLTPVRAARGRAHVPSPDEPVRGPWAPFRLQASWHATCFVLSRIKRQPAVSSRRQPERAVGRGTAPLSNERWRGHHEKSRGNHPVRGARRRR